jgi:hypothetical protein
MTIYANTETFEEFRASATIPEGKRGRITWITSITTNPEVLQLEHLSLGKRIAASVLFIAQRKDPIISWVLEYAKSKRKPMRSR